MILSRYALLVSYLFQQWEVNTTILEGFVYLLRPILSYATASKVKVTDNYKI